MVTRQAHFSTSSSIVLHFLFSLNKRGRRKAFWVLRAFRGAALKIVPIVRIRRALPKAPIFGLPHSTAIWLEVYPPPFQRGLLGMTVSDHVLFTCGVSIHMLTLYSCSIVLQQGTSVGVIPGTKKHLCF